MTEADRQAFERAAQKGASYDATRPGIDAAKAARVRGDYEVLDYLIQLRDERLISAFAEGQEPATAELEARIVRHFDDRPVATVLISSLKGYKSPELFEKLFGDVESLAQWRARRRHDCRAVIWSVMGMRPIDAPEPSTVKVSPYAPPPYVQPGAAMGQARQPPQSAQLGTKSAPSSTATTTPPPSYPSGQASQIIGVQVVRAYGTLPGQPKNMRGALPGEANGVGWAYTCNPPLEDDPATDLDGRRKDTYRSREDASVAAIALTQLPKIEERLAPLFADVSVLPPDDWVHFGKRPALLRFDATRPMPASWINLMRERGRAPAWKDVAAVLDRVELRPRSAFGNTQEWSTVSSLLTLAAVTGERAATLDTIEWIQRAHENGAPPEMLPILIARLGPVLPEAQVDLSEIKKRLVGGPPYAPTAALGNAFALVEEDNRSLREPSAMSLSRWIPTADAHRLVAYLLSKGADPNGSMGASGLQPPLVTAASKPAMAALLLDHGADPNIGRGGPMTALQAACSNPETFALLLKRGADPGVRAYGGSAALHTAAIGCAECVRALLALHVPVDVTDEQGKTPLHYASRVDTAKLLLDAGANPNAADRSGESPFSLAYFRPPADPLRVLLESRGGRLTVAQRARRLKEQADFMRSFVK